MPIRHGAGAHRWTVGNMPPIGGLMDEQVIAVFATYGVSSSKRASGSGPGA